MEKIFKRPAVPITILLCVCWYLFFFQLGNLALTDPDETFYAQTAKEMLRRGEWITPYLFDRPQFEKPIFFYWLVKVSFKLFGVNEFAARLPSAIFGSLGVIAIYYLGALFFGRRAGFFSALILASNVEYIVLSRGCLTDMTLFSLMLIGVTLFFYGRDRGSAGRFILSSAAFGLATLTKGPIAIALPVMVFFAYSAFARGRAMLKKVPWLRTIAVFFLITAPWYMAIYLLYRKEFLEAFFGFQNITRFFESEHKIGSQFYYNIPVMFAGFFPWSVFLPFGFWRIFKRTQCPILDTQSETARRRSIFLLCWFLVIFLFFTVSSTKLPTYIFPCWISLALIVGVLWDELISGNAGRGVIFGFNISYCTLLSAIFLTAIGALIFIRYDYPEMLGASSLSAVMLIFGFIVSAAFFLKRMYLGSFSMIALAVMLFLYPVGRFVIPQIERHESSKEIARNLLRYMKPGEKLGSESHYLSGLAFYTDKVPVNMDPHHILVQFLESEKRVWFVLKEKNHIQIYTLDTPPFCRRPSYAVYKLGKKVIATNMVPDDGRYIIKRERKE